MKPAQHLSELPYWYQFIRGQCQNKHAAIICYNVIFNHKDETINNIVHNYLRYTRTKELCSQLKSFKHILIPERYILILYSFYTESIFTVLELPNH